MAHIGIHLATGSIVIAISGQALAFEGRPTRVPNTEPRTSVLDRDGSPASEPQARFVDLTIGDLPMAMPSRDFPPDTVPRTHFVDLSNGAAQPSIDKPDENGRVGNDTIVITADKIDDPYEEANRGRFKTHVALHHYVIDPVEEIYIQSVPELLRIGIHNFLTNLETPAVLINDLLQGDTDRAGDTLSRFVINTSLGLGGILDIGGNAGIPYRDDDFGQTLAHYGVQDYPYLLVPVIGPTNPRDLGGKVVDVFFNPLHYIAVPGGFITSAGQAGLHEVDKRSEDVGELDQLSRSAGDPYAAERTRARAQRKAEINGPSGTSKGK